MANFSRNSVERSSNTTISSVDAEEKVKRHLDSRTIQTLSSDMEREDQKIIANINIQSSSAIKVGDSNVTTVNQYYYPEVMTSLSLITMRWCLIILIFIKTDKRINNSKCFWCMIVIITIGVFVATVTTVIFLKRPFNPPTIPVVPPDEWEANPPKGNLTILQLPAASVVVSHTADGDSCTSRIECIARVREIQASYSDLIDIPFNFLVYDGHVYEGRGFVIKVNFRKTI